MREGNRRGVIIIASILIVVFIIILSTIFFGIRSIGKIIIFLLGFLLVLSILGIAFWAIWYLFIKKQKYDATYQNKKRLIEAARMSKSEDLQDLYLSGDKEHSRVRLGKIIGYCRIKIMKKITEYDKETGEPVMIEGEERKKVEKTKLEQEEQDVFVIERGGFIMKHFIEPMVIRIKPEEHDSLVGDVTIKGFSLVPISEYYFLHQDYLDVRKIDFNILKEAERGIYFESLKDTKEIIDKAIGLDSSHKKENEKKNLVEIPAIGAVNKQ